MPAKRQKAAQSSASLTCIDRRPFLALPRELIHQVLGMLDNDSLLKLLQTSKAMAQQVMQHSSDSLKLKLAVKQDVNMAATRQLLQWAPPACLQLMLAGGSSRDPNGYPTSYWESLHDLFGTHSTGGQPCSHPGQRFPCVWGVIIKGFSLPSLVPADLAAACPNLRLIHLDECKLESGRQAGSSKGRSRGSKQTGSSSGGTTSKCVVWPTMQAKNLHTLALGDIFAPELQNLASVSARLTRSTEAAVGFADQLRASVPNVRCLKLCSQKPCADFIWPLLGPQLAELHVQSGYLPAVGGIKLGPHLQLLHKLLLPGLVSAAGMDLLLSLPNLTHVQLGAVSQLTEDYSSRPCKWQSLQLGLTRVYPGLRLDTLAKLPLHSLSQPLTLGNEHADSLEVTVPEDLVVLQALAQQLKKCGVKVLPAQLVWQPQFWYSNTPRRHQFSHSLELTATAFGPHADVQLSGMLIDKTVMQAVATVYKTSLKRLTFYCCNWAADLQPSWHAILSGCPCLVSVEKWGPSDDEELTECLKDLMAAMAQEPAGRCLELRADCHTSEMGPTGLIAQARDQLREVAQAVLANVGITVIDHQHPSCFLLERQ